MIPVDREAIPMGLAWVDPETERLGKAWQWARLIFGDSPTWERCRRASELLKGGA